ncbi:MULTISPECIES: LysR family transcriptional regulator [Acinetobacter]|uniref:LysR family transcriptional regulator n=1 Tax=Acinetobacter TaxID=469 RepID=UPI0007A0AE5E|nr:LysR family transcriptional regulator [Acinetobacter sp. NRRL B-65365]KYQ83459.1 LysR family transcriptional regulator [Acinetobacter sp. NRRL B-65365]
MEEVAYSDIKLIRIFVSVVRNKGFANAQQELNLSTSAISTYMTQLEQIVGFKLCERGRGGFSLTQKGEMFLQEAKRILHELENFSRHTAQIKGELTGTLRIGMLDSMVTDQNIPLDQMIREFSKQNPHIYIKIQVQSPYELQMGILENRFDVAIGSFFMKMNGVMYQPLHKEQQWLFCSDKHPMFAHQNLTADVIRQGKMVSRGYWSHTELAKQGFKHSFATVDSMEAQLILILSGQYIGYLPEHFAQFWVEQKRLKVLLPAMFGYCAPFSLIFRRGRTRELVIQNFRKTVKSFFTEK